MGAQHHSSVQVVADQQLQELGVGESFVVICLGLRAVSIAVLDCQLGLLELSLVYNDGILFRCALEEDLEHAGLVLDGLERHVVDDAVKRLEYLLKVPEGAVLPFALGTVLNGDTGEAC